MLWIEKSTSILLENRWHKFHQVLLILVICLYNVKNYLFEFTIYWCHGRVHISFVYFLKIKIFWKLLILLIALNVFFISFFHFYSESRIIHFTDGFLLLWNQHTLDLFFIRFSNVCFSIYFSYAVAQFSCSWIQKKKIIVKVSSFLKTHLNNFEFTKQAKIKIINFYSHFIFSLFRFLLPTIRGVIVKHIDLLSLFTYTIWLCVSDSQRDAKHKYFECSKIYCIDIYRY